MFGIEMKRQMLGPRPLILMGVSLAIAAVMAVSRLVAARSGLILLEGYDLFGSMLFFNVILVPGILGAIESAIALGRDWSLGMVRTRIFENVGRGAYMFAKIAAAFLRQAAAWGICLAPVLFASCALGLESVRLQDGVLGSTEIAGRLRVLVLVSFLAAQVPSALALLLCILTRGRSFLSAALSIAAFVLAPLVFAGFLSTGTGTLMQTGNLPPGTEGAVLICIAGLIAVMGISTAAALRLFSRIDIKD
jgi:hypothetical protein